MLKLSMLNIKLSAQLFQHRMHLKLRKKEVALLYKVTMHWFKKKKMRYDIFLLVDLAGGPSVLKFVRKHKYSLMMIPCSLFKSEYSMTLCYSFCRVISQEIYQKWVHIVQLEMRKILKLLNTFCYKKNQPVNQN